MSGRLLSRFISRKKNFQIPCSVATNVVNSGCVLDYKMSACAANFATKCLTMDDMNPNVKVMEYAVRGPLVIRALEIEKELKQVCYSANLKNLSNN